MQTSLLAIANKAKDRKHYRFLNLYRLIGDENFLLDCWSDIRKNAAYGVDRVSAQQYGENLIDNIRNLIDRLKRKSYRARLVRRHYIPKPDGHMRPLGIPVVEDKLLQLAVTRILGAIYEQDFLRCSYGYRPNKGALDAVDKLTVKLQFGRYNFVVEADIKGFFDNIDHDRLIELLSLRVADRSLLRLIKKWLKAGVLDTDGKVIHPVSGTPQGGIISPMLANVYLHYALDQWFQEVVKANMKGEACLIRYADDFVCAFEYEQDAKAFFKALEFRLEKFGLQLAADKTRVIHFSRSNKSGSSRFDFLGVEFRWDRLI
jgi:RNA-directed DNA polymerase